jgi:acetyl-CoA carboxylase biotin carboxylase subunit
MDATAASAGDVRAPAMGGIRRVLVANRGEIAVRIIRACHELGLEAVQVYSEADADELAVRMADRSVCIGLARSSDSYLQKRTLLSAALTCGAQAIHPGYGFLSENADFAGMCESAGIIFIGPRAETIRQMGDKIAARQIARAAGVQTIPGSAGKLASLAEARAIARDIGYPILLKASAGGGGRGMRIAREEPDLEAAFSSAGREAKAAFGDDAVYMEKYLTRIRHIEVQVLGDGKDVWQFGERDCSIQRRNQKLIEESPSPALSASLREEFAQAALRLCRHVDYLGAGTVEFVLDEDTGKFYFIEMNTRIQVEHAVTEMVTGFDLVKAQILIAAGVPLHLRQDDIKMSGHAIECRINAEDYEHDFMPCPGRIGAVRMPGGPGVRVDSHLYGAYTVPPYYDSLLAKLICWGQTRGEALARMRRALQELQIEGIKTTAGFHSKLLEHEAFRQGRCHTGYIGEVFNPPGGKAA